jgi:hypothetical protein
MRLPPIKIRSVCCRSDLIADLGRTDAVAFSLTISVERFTDAAKAFAKDVEKTKSCGARHRRGRAKLTERIDYARCGSSAMMLAVLVGPICELVLRRVGHLHPGAYGGAYSSDVYQQIEVFLYGMRDERKGMGCR